MTDEIKKITIKLGPRSFAQAADDLEQIARAVRAGALWSLPPGIMVGGSVDMQLPEPPKEDAEEVAEEPEAKPAAKAKK